MRVRLAEAAIDVEAVTAGYGARKVVENISFESTRGEVLALLGPNGSGKTTLLKALCGAIPTMSGRVRIEGRGLETLTFQERSKHISYVPQSEEHLFDFTVRQLTLMGRLAHSEGLFESALDQETAIKAMEASDCVHLADRSLSTLSGGESQRALIARALAQETPIILCDEPTTHLDPGHQVEIGKLLVKLRKEGKVVLVTTHDLNWALEFSDRVLMLHRGTTKFIGTLNDAIDQDIHEQVYDTRFKTLSASGKKFVVPAVD